MLPKAQLLKCFARDSQTATNFRRKVLVIVRIFRSIKAVFRTLIVRN